ncbi:hypothetical protein HOO54_14420 [Bacillus sp. WMMC1349]|uniref:ribonuclease YeeF family protein n=1 Tax=Bacillus sp. WMMC1349 TaxID=2736254 RepID=UPI0015532228|nr:T7SS effector LXG polymorphic toxin [Bacillus sp. WMMC1349]NPC93399.1 hypothetical protein [Bacillus sp. WMMC1349]
MADKKKQNNELDSSAKVFEASTLVERADQRKKDYENLKEKLQTLKTACLGVADLGDDFTGKGADNIKEFFRGQAEVVDSWITLADMQISFFNGVSGDIEAKKLPDSYIEMSFLKTELKNADKKSDQIVDTLKNNMDRIINRVNDIVDLDKWTDHNYTVEMSKAQTTRKNAIDAVDDLDKSLTGEYTQALAEAESVSKKLSALMEATSNGKSASPMYFDKKAFHSNKLYKEAIKTDKQATTYINAKKEQAEARRIAELQEKLANVSDPDEYVKMAKEIGYNNLSPEQQERLTEIKEDKEFWDNPFLGTLNKAGDMVVGSASEAFEAGKSIASDVGESLENGLHTIAHPIETMENVRDGLHAIGEEIDNAASAVWDKVSHPKEILNATWDNITHPMETLEGIGEGIKNVASDTVDGVLYTVNHPFETIAGVSHVVSHPVDTLNIMKKGIADSFERDVINGDAKSRAKWFMYATGTVATSVVGTKGVDKLGKAAKLGKLGKAGSKAYKISKKIREKTIRVPKKALKKVLTNPLAEKLRLGALGRLPINALNLKKLGHDFIQFIKKKFSRNKGTLKLDLQFFAEKKKGVGNVSVKRPNGSSQPKSNEPFLKVKRKKEATKSTGKVTEKHEDKNVQKGKHGDGDPKTPHQSKSKPHESVHKVDKPHESNKDAGTVPGKHPHESSKPKKHEPEKDVDNGSKGTRKYSTTIDDKVKVIEKIDLPDWISESFTDGYYRTVITEENITFYRTYGGGAKVNGAFVTTIPAGNRINAKISTALVPDWKNSRQYEAVIEVPKGQVLNIGKVEKQYTKTGALLEGDGDQILLPQGWPSEWIKEIKQVPSR